MDFPQYADMVKLLSNPITFGILVSLIWEQTALFREDKASPFAKMGLVAATGLLWSLVVSIMRSGGLPQSWSEVYNVVMIGVATVASTQVFHKLINAYLPALAALLVQLRIGQAPIDAVATTLKMPSAVAVTGQPPLSVDPILPTG